MYLKNSLEPRYLYSIIDGIKHEIIPLLRNVNVNNNLLLMCTPKTAAGKFVIKYPMKNALKI